MSFFPRTLYNSEASSTPFFSVLDDFDTYSRGGSNYIGPKHSHISHWQPKFDVRETSHAFYFYGELPGLTKDEITIEFPKEQHMTIRGKTERSYTSGTPPAVLEYTNKHRSAAMTEAGERRYSYQATVEDEAYTEKSNDRAVAAPYPYNNNLAAKAAASAAPADNSKYLITERSIGEFSRHFKLPSRIDQDGVTASLKDGILTIDVPKAKKHEPRRVAVN